MNYESFFFVAYGEMIDQGKLITQAVDIPVIGDGDNGYGNAMNVKRTVKGFVDAGDRKSVV